MVTCAETPPGKIEDGHVFKSRRGLLAAGLVVAVTGTLGVSSTLNAEADVLPSPRTEQQVAASAESVTTDRAVTTADLGVAAPKVTWGAPSRPNRRGPAGASSESLRAGGFVSAPSTARGSGPEKRFVSGTRRTDVSHLGADTPPAPSSDPTTPPPPGDEDGQYYSYAEHRETKLVTDGLHADFDVAKPYVGKDDYHSLAELSVGVGPNGKRNYVEVGWRVSYNAYKDYDPHVFTFFWVDGEPGCYDVCQWSKKDVCDECGLVLNSEKNAPRPRDTLAVGASVRFAIQNVNGGWWVGYGNKWIGYYPNEIWSKSQTDFSKAADVRAFGEVSAGASVSCSAMGTGIDSSNEGAAKIANIVYWVNGVRTAKPVTLKLRSTGTSTYTVTGLTDPPRTFRYGGWIPSAASESPTVSPNVPARCK